MPVGIKRIRFFLILIGYLFLPNGSYSSTLINEPYQLYKYSDFKIKQRVSSLVRQGRHQIRTQHIDGNGEPLFTNNLLFEESPYLLQHAHNPIHWYPWSKEAFRKAQQENKPIFLSIGYASCHWCHVMEEESFDNVEIADLLSRNYISVKVDREQRPDLDEIYMMASSMISGKNGWPITAILTPKGKPIFSTSYLSRESLIDILMLANNKWLQTPNELKTIADEIYSDIQSMGSSSESSKVQASSLTVDVIQRMLDYEDKHYGGIDEVPKFPISPKIHLMLNHILRTNGNTDSQSWLFIQKMLNGMSKGAIYDQIGGGFHRYATDIAWRKPHFEKTLYNQAQISLLYHRAWVFNQNPDYKRISRETVDFVLRDLLSSDGCFFSGMDADSNGQEGLYYLWSPKEIEALLPRIDTQFIYNLYNIKAADESSQALYLSTPLQFNKITSDNSFQNKNLLSIHQIMRDYRTTRSPLSIDIKQITQWNAMMIMSLAIIGNEQQIIRYSDAAKQCAEIIWNKGRDAKGHLYRSLIASKATGDAVLADYAYYIQALLTLYDISNNPIWLNRATSIYKVMVNVFSDKIHGGFYNSTLSENESFDIRTKVSLDSDMASGNSAALQALVMLSKRNNTLSIQSEINRSIMNFSNQLNDKPLTLPSMLDAIEQYRDPVPRVIAYAAGGNIKVTSRFTSNNNFNISILISKNWHINSHTPLNKKFISTSLTSETISPQNMIINYPVGELIKVGFDEQPLSLYQGSIEINVEIPPKEAKLFHSYSLTLQACNDKQCLLPEKVNIYPLRLF